MGLRTFLWPNPDLAVGAISYRAWALGRHQGTATIRIDETSSGVQAPDEGDIGLQEGMNHLVHEVLSLTEATGFSPGL